MTVLIVVQFGTFILVAIFGFYILVPATRIGHISLSKGILLITSWILCMAVISLNTPVVRQPLEDQNYVVNYPPNLSPELIGQLEKGADVTVEKPDEIRMWGYKFPTTIPLQVGKKAFIKGGPQHITLQYYAPPAPLTRFQKVLSQTIS